MDIYIINHSWSDEPKKDQRLCDTHEGDTGQRIVRQRNYSIIQVYRGEQDGTKLPCAVKVLEKKLSTFFSYEVDQDDYLKSALFSEIQILQLLKSENVVSVLDVMESSHNYYIIQEICDSDLEKYINQHPKVP